MDINKRIELIKELEEIEKRTGKYLSGGIEHLTDDNLHKMVMKLRINNG